MIVASFLTKDLLLDWRLGERFVLQSERFDPDGRYVRRFVPELRDLPDRFAHRPWEAPRPPEGYPPPLVDHAQRRLLALERFQAARAGGRR